MTEYPSPSLVVLVGPPGAGKTTWLEENLRDAVRVDLEEIRRNPDADRNEVIRGAISRTFDELGAGRVVAFDSTGIRSGFRSRLRGLAHSLDVPVYAVVFDVPLEELLAAQESRTYPVPDDRVRELHDEFQNQLDAIYAEDWDGTQTVRRAGGERSARAINADLRVTEAIAAAARKGLELHEQGKSGDGLVPATVADARKMAGRELLSEAKVRKMPGWFARHATDKTPDWDKAGDETPGYVAWLLWGGDTAQAWAERKVNELDMQDERSQQITKLRVDVTVEMDSEEEEVEQTEEPETEESVDDAPDVLEAARERSASPVKVDYRESGAGANYRTITGYASVFGRLSEDLGGFREIIAPGAFRNALERGAPVKLLYDHDSAAVLASTSNGTLELREDETGLRVWARVDMTDPDVQRVEAKLRSGIVDQMSFAFTTNEDEWDYTGGMPVRTVRSVDDLFEVSVVAFPAYNMTKVEMLERALNSGRLPSGGATDVAPITAGGESRDEVSDAVRQRAAYWRARLNLSKQKAS